MGLVVQTHAGLVAFNLKLIYINWCFVLFLNVNNFVIFTGSPLKALEELSDVVCDRPFGFADIKSFLHLLKDEERIQLIDHISILTADVYNRTD